jgi:hypothetical protein
MSTSRMRGTPSLTAGHPWAVLALYSFMTTLDTRRT